MYQVEMVKSRKAATAICHAQIRAGRKVLKAKTRKQAQALLKKVPHRVSGNLTKGLAWWDHIQQLKTVSPNQTAMNAVIEGYIPQLLEGCINKHMAL
jgi:hypothetical protein